MKKLNENLSEIFDVTPIEVPEPPTFDENKSTEIIVHEDQTDVEADYILARNNLKSLIKKGDSAVEEIIKVASESEHPRAFEVAATFLKTMADLNKDLLELQKKRRDLNVEQQSKSGQTTNIDKAVFVGSTAELIKMIKEQ